MQSSPVSASSPPVQGTPPASFDQSNIEKALAADDREQAVSSYATVIQQEPQSNRSIWSSFLIKLLQEPYELSSTTNLSRGLKIKSYSLEGPYGFSEELHLVYRNDRLVTVIPAKIAVDRGKLTATSYWRCYNTRVIFQNPSRNIEKNNLVLQALGRGTADLFNTIKTIRFVKNVPGDAIGVYRRSRTIDLEDGIDSDAFIHETFHYWDHVLADFTMEGGPQLHDDPADVGRIFYEISWRRAWQDGHRTWRRRENDRDDFRGGTFISCATRFCMSGPAGFRIAGNSHPYGMENPAEDLATMGEDYVTAGVALRAKVRKNLAAGNIELAVKYLFSKHLSPFKGREFDLSESSPALTISEVNAAMQAFPETSDHLVRAFDDIRRLVGELPEISATEPKAVAAAQPPELQPPQMQAPTGPLPLPPPPAPESLPPRREPAAIPASVTPPASAPVLDRARSWHERALSVFGGYVDYLWGASAGDRASEGEAYGVFFRPSLAAISPSLRLFIQAGKNAVERSASETDSRSFETFERLSSKDRFDMSMGLEFNKEDLYRVNLRLRPDLYWRASDLALTVRYCSVEQCLGSVDYKGSHNAVVLGSSAGLDVKLHPSEDVDVLLRMDGGFHVLFPKTSVKWEDADIEGSPAYQMERARLKENGDDEGIAALDDSQDPWYAWFVRPALGFVFPSADAVGLYKPAVSIGASIEEDPIMTSDYGLWELVKYVPFNAGAVATFASAFHAGKGRRLQIPLDLAIEVGNYFRFTADIGLGWNFDSALLQIAGDVSLYRNTDHGESVERSTIGLDLSVAF